MKQIEKMLMIGWGYIDFKIISFAKELGFLTGENGGGKSTIIDALQVVIGGDTSGKHFNKAANEKSKRTMLTYLRGMNIVKDEGEIKYLRNEDCTSYIVLQVKDTEINRHFCLGIVCDVTCATNEYSKAWFYLDESLPVNRFLRDGTPFGIDEFKRTFIQSRMNNKIFSTNQEYQEYFRSKKAMGNIKKDFYNVFPNAVAFKPPENMKTFLENFFCENIDVSIDDLKENIFNYKRLEQTVKNMEEQITLLQAVSENYKEYSSLQEKIYLSKYTIDICNLKKKELEKQNSLNNIKENESSRDKKELSKEKGEKELKSIKEKANELRKLLIKAESDLGITDIQNSIEKVTIQINQAKDTQEGLIKIIRNYGRWESLFDTENTEEILMGNNINTEKILELFYKLKNICITKEELTELDGYLIKCRESLNKFKYDLDENLKKTKKLIISCEEVISNAEKGIKSYNPRLQEFKEILSVELGKVFKENLSVDILADLIEIKNLEWSNAIEGYLSKAKFFIVVNAKYYDSAIDIYKSLDEKRFNDIGIINTKKIMELEISPKANSLYNELDCSNKFADQYMKYFLGKVIKCNNISETEKYNTAITKDCFVYSKYVLSRMNPALYENKYIGKNALKNTIIMKKQELIMLKDKKEETLIDMEMLKIHSTLSSLGEAYIEDIMEKIKIVSLLEDLELRKGKLIKKLKDIDCSIIEQYGKELELVDREQDDIEEKIIVIRSEIESLRKELDIKNEAVKIFSKEIETLINSIQKKYSEEFLLKHKVEVEREIEALKVVSSLNARIYKIGNENEVMEDNSYKTFESLTDSRTKLIKYGFDKGISSRTNEKYDEYLEELTSSSLPRYKSNIEKEKKNAYEEFRSELLCRIHDAIEKTSRQIKDINRTLKKFTFGKVSYKFEMKSSSRYRKFYSMLTDELLIDSNPLSIGVFLGKYNDEISELFDEIMERSESVEEKNRVLKNVKTYTNYKTYIDLDMICIGEDGEGSSVSESFKYDSGGETQNPFYITVLASFYQLYQMDKESGKDNMRLIVFDEAFNKMDRDRIKSSINLVKQLGFQALIAAPSEKIALIAPEVDSILHVQTLNKENTIIAEFTNREEKQRFIEAYKGA